jgi:hypothetical protein
MKDLKEQIIEAVQDATDTVDGTVSITILDHFIDGILSEQLRQPPVVGRSELLCEVCNNEQVFETEEGFIADCPRCN